MDVDQDTGGHPDQSEGRIELLSAVWSRRKFRSPQSIVVQEAFHGVFLSLEDIRGELSREQTERMALTADIGFKASAHEYLFHHRFAEELRKLSKRLSRSREKVTKLQQREGEFRSTLTKLGDILVKEFESHDSTMKESERQKAELHEIRESRARKTREMQDTIRHLRSELNDQRVELEDRMSKTIKMHAEQLSAQGCTTESGESAAVLEGRIISMRSAIQQLADNLKAAREESDRTARVISGCDHRAVLAERRLADVEKQLSEQGSVLTRAFLAEQRNEQLKCELEKLEREDGKIKGELQNAVL